MMYVNPRYSSMAMLAVLVVFFMGLLPFSIAEIRYSEIQSDARPIIPFDEFGFTQNGRLEIYVTDAAYKAAKEINAAYMGFFLSTRDTWIHVLQQLERNEVRCVLESKLIKKLFTFADMKGSSHFNMTFDGVDANQYTLVFANCISEILVSMNVKTVMYNLEGDEGTKDFLSAGETVLPKLYFSLFIIYVVLGEVWIYVCVKYSLLTYRIHIFMAYFKALNPVCEAEDKSYRTGTTHGRDVLFYIFNFFKGILLFLLIGTRWSFLKPYL